MSSEFQIRITVYIGYLIALVLFPFLVMHLYQGDGAVVSIISAIIAFELFYVVQAKKGGNPSIAAHILAAVHTCSAILVIYLLGVSGSYWLFPVLFSNFYVIPRRSAALINGLATIAGVLLLRDHLEFAFRLLATLTIMNVLGFVFSRQVEIQHKRLNELSLIDPLTLAGNRRALEDQLAMVSNLNVRHNWHMSAILIDIDHFKQINDQYDHQVGDTVLIGVVNTIKNRLRATDTLYRYGGEEFIVLALHTTLPEAQHLAEELRCRVEELRIGDVSGITLSAGVAELLTGETTEDWLARSDKAMYKAKQRGRNRVETAS